MTAISDLCDAGAHGYNRGAAPNLPDVERAIQAQAGCRTGSLHNPVLARPRSAPDAAHADAERVARLEAALGSFREVFGAPAEGFAAPDHAWDATVELTLANAGVRCLQAAHIQCRSWAAAENGRWTTQPAGCSPVSALCCRTRTVDFEPVVRPNSVAAATRRACLLLRRGVPDLTGALVGRHPT